VLRIRSERCRPTGSPAEGGFTLILSLFVMLVVSLVTAAVVLVAVHVGSATGQNRAHTEAVHAAEAGIQETMARLSRADGSTWCAPLNGALPGGGAPGGEQYSVTVSDSAGVPGVCSPNDPVRLIDATGYSPSLTAPDPTVRRLEARVQLLPAGAAAGGGYGFPDAIQASAGAPGGILTTPGSLNVVAPAGGPPASAEVTGDLNLSASDRVAGSVVADGAVTLADAAHITGDLTATGDITLSGAAVVDGNVTSTGGAVTLSGSAQVGGTARASGVVTITGSAATAGTVEPNSPSATPAFRPMPAFSFSGASPPWPAPPSAYPDCGAGFPTTLSGTLHVTGDCDLASMSLTVSGPAALVVDGAITIRGTTQFLASGGSSSLWLIANHPSTGVGDTAGLTIQDAAFFDPQLPVFAFAANVLTKSAPGPLTGALVGGAVTITAPTTLTFVSSSPPGFSFPAGYVASTSPGFVTQLEAEREL
jgi:type II secretory pathway pseudopilin PulG